MIFGEIKGLGADRSWHHTGVVLFAIICLSCLAGFLSGFDSTTFRELKSGGFWGMTEILFFVGELAGFGSVLSFSSNVAPDALDRRHR